MNYKCLFLEDIKRLKLQNILIPSKGPYKNLAATKIWLTLVYN